MTRLVTGLVSLHCNTNRGGALLHCEPSGLRIVKLMMKGNWKLSTKAGIPLCVDNTEPLASWKTFCTESYQYHHYETSAT